MAPRTSVPSVESQRPRGSLTFLQPEPEPDVSPSDPPASLSDETTWSDLPSSRPPLDDSPSLSAEPSDELDEPSDDAPTSSRGSSTSSALSKRVLRDAIREGVAGASVLANEHLTRDELEHDLGLYLADEGDVQAIADPLASIANRRGGLGGASNPDVGDAIAAAIGLAIYATKQLKRWRAARAMRRGANVQPINTGQDPAGDTADVPA